MGLLSEFYSKQIQKFNNFISQFSLYSGGLPYGLTEGDILCVFSQ